MKPRRAAMAMLMTFGTAITGPIAPAVAAESVPPLSLPAPTGRHPVGSSMLHLRDDSRSDPWNPPERRELMVSVWYPSMLRVGRPAPYLGAEESKLFLQRQQITGVPADVLATTKTHARVDAPPVPKLRGLPLVVLSPGWSHPRAALTGLAVDLASRGYVVAAIDHNYEAAGVAFPPSAEFPDGRVTTCTACEIVKQPKEGVNWPLEVRKWRALDVSFVLDRLTGPRPAWPGSWIIDPRRIAMVGHSTGGASVADTVLADARVRVGINLDGTFNEPLTGPIDRPFLLLGSPAQAPSSHKYSWQRSWGAFTGWRRWLTVDRSTHISFTDLAPLQEQMHPGSQALDGVRAADITRTYVAAALDEHVRNGDATVLDGPSPRYPEVAFHPAPDGT